MSADLVATMVAGPNGSGKSTLTDELRRQGYDLGEYINADEIAKTLAGDYNDRVREAQGLAEAQRQVCIAERRSFSFETVMSHVSKVELLAQARAAGFRTVLFFVATDDPSLNVARVAQRVALGGHPVPENLIRERYERVMKFLPAAIAEADRAVLFDNSYSPAPGQPVDLRPILEVRRTARAQFTLEILPPLPSWGDRLVKILKSAPAQP